MTRSPKTKRIVAALAAATILVSLFMATAPHAWIGRFFCEIRGGEWTNRYSTPTESLVSAGYRCEGV